MPAWTNYVDADASSNLLVGFGFSFNIIGSCVFVEFMGGLCLFVNLGSIILL